MFFPATLRRKPLQGQMMELAGWWSVYFPWDHQALLRYSPAELVWFLLKRIRVSEVEDVGIGPLRLSIATLKMLPWEGVAQWCEESRGRRNHRHLTNDTRCYEAFLAALTFPCMPLWVRSDRPILYF